MPGTVITVTPNTAFDYIVDVPRFRFPGGAKAERSSLYASGKGINVARIATALGVPARAIGLVGASTLQRFQAYSSPLLQVELFPVAGDTRINVTILDTAEMKLSHIRTSGFSGSEHDVCDLVAAIDRSASTGDVVVIAGSLPPRIKADAAARLVEAAQRSGAVVIVDCAGDVLRAALGMRPDLVKPNVAELEEHVGKSLAHSEDAIIRAARGVLKEGARTVVVSRGDLGILAVTQNDEFAWRAHVDISSERLASKRGIGSGDALVAGLAVSQLNERPLSDALRLGVACGAAKRFTRDPGDCPSSIITDLRTRVRVEKISK